MNAAQRKYLIDKIKYKSDLKIKELEGSKVKPPKLSAYILHWILSDKCEIVSNEEIKRLLKEKALNGVNSNNPDDFLDNGDSWRSAAKNKVSFNFQEFFVLPEDYRQSFERARSHNAEIEEKIRQLSIQAESLETRIMLASDKTLQKMINEVDDMGDISLIDTKIKLLQ